MKLDVTNKVREFCDECGVEFWRAPGRRKRRCDDCRHRALEANMDAHHYRSGPIYEEYVVTQLAFWRSEKRRLGLK